MQVAQIQGCYFFSIPLDYKQFLPPIVKQEENTRAWLMTTNFHVRSSHSQTSQQLNCYNNVNYKELYGHTTDWGFELVRTGGGEMA